jgi:hypothetical protein
LNPLNLCRACGNDFTSVKLFDRHRVGVHAYDYSPERPDGRRCLSAEEMLENGWRQDARGRWIDPVRVADARARSDLQRRALYGVPRRPFQALRRPGESLGSRALSDHCMEGGFHDAIGS